MQQSIILIPNSIILILWRIFALVYTPLNWSMSAPQLPELTIKLVYDSLALHHNESTIETIVVFDKEKLIGVSNELSYDFAVLITKYSSEIIENSINTPLGKVKFVKLNFGSNNLIIIPSNEFSIAAIVKK